jgi:hypothetical protein
MIESLFVLFLSVGGNPIEWTPHFKLSDCLAVKRKIERNIGKRAGERYSCKKDTVEVKKVDDTYIIVKFIEE